MNTTTATASSVAQNLSATTLATLRAAVDQLRTEYPNAGQRLEHAQFILIAREVEQGGRPGQWWVGSETDPSQQYLVLNRAGEAPSCTCQDWARRGAQVGICKHLAAVVLLERLERAEAATDPTPEPPPVASAPRPAAVDVDAPIDYILTPAALAALDEARQRMAARCPDCGDFKGHGRLFCAGDHCSGTPSPCSQPTRRLAVIA
jgi:hypothetical protein